MGKWLSIILLSCSATSYAMVTFDPQNFAQSVKMHAEQLNSLRELKQQTQYHIAEYKAICQQLKMQQASLKKLDVNMLTELYNSYNRVQTSVDQAAGLIETLNEISTKYGNLFGTNTVQLSDAEQNFLKQQHLRHQVATNKRAMHALKVLKAQPNDQRTTTRLVEESQRAAGQMQALQAANQLAAVQIKQLQEVKLLLGQQLEQQSVAVAEENTARVLANHRFQQAMAQPKPTYNGITLPNFKK